jgi:DNA-binding winged helix-turn-helix (wHTH) protein
MKSRLFIALLLFGIVLLLSSAVIIRQNPQDEFLEKRAALVVRQIGHTLLQHAGDSTSRVLPVQQLSPGTFQLEFQNQFSFVPDTLVKIVRTNLAQIDLPAGYMINVFDCGGSKELVYGFEIRPNYKELVPCLGRVQPKGCYSIQISFIDFKSQQHVSSNYVWLLVGFTGVVLIAFTGGYYFKREKKKETDILTDDVAIGKYSFFLGSRVLKFNSETIELSDKEARLLSILANQQNQLISREELLKRVWEDDGVFTGRSLDMFISKLRKKLKEDPTIRITNVHGKGYKLEIKS